MKKSEFKLTDKSPNGTHLVGYYPCSFQELQQMLGAPNGETDDYKVSTEWRLKDSEGKVITLYDYKETSLYSKGLPSVEEFRNFQSYDWHIGAQDGNCTARFVDWLDRKRKKLKSHE